MSDDTVGDGLYIAQRNRELNGRPGVRGGPRDVNHNRRGGVDGLMVMTILGLMMDLSGISGVGLRCGAGEGIGLRTERVGFRDRVRG